MNRPTTDPSGPGPERSITTVAAELADVERYLTEVPPHSGGGREHLAQRREALQRELSALRARRPS